MDDRAQLLRSLSIDREKDAGTSSGRRFWLMPGLILAVAAVIAAGGAAVWFSRQPVTAQQQATETARPQAAAPSPAPAALPVQEPRRAGNLIASGYVVARRKATIAAEITGKVSVLMVEEGMTVREGQVLARLDSVLAEKDLALAQSRITAAEAASSAIEADLRDARRIYGRTRTLSQQKFASEADLTKAEARADVLAAQLRQAESQLASARLDAQRTAAVLDKHEIRAPFGGVVIERSAQPGEVISPMSAGGYTRTGICTIVDMDSIEIEVDVNEAFIGRLSAGTGANAVLDAYPDWTIPGAVIAIVPAANREKATVKVRIGLKQKDLRILPDMAVKVTFLEDTAAAQR
jgi:HlyD family secretion protein